MPLLGAAPPDAAGIAGWITSGKRAGGDAVFVRRLDPATGTSKVDFVMLGRNGRGARFAAVGDLDGDGALDLVLWDWDATEVTVRRGDKAGFGAGEAEPQALSLEGRLQILFVADVTGDGRAHVVALTADPKRSSHVKVTAYSADPAFHFTAGLDAPSFEASWPALAVGDWSGDGVADLVASSSDRTLTAWRATGKGFFEAAATPLELTFVPWGATLVDVNGDRRADLLTLEDVRIIVPIDLDGDDKTDLALYDYGRAIGLVYGDGTGRFGNRPAR